MNLADCPEDGKLLLRIRFKHQSDGSYAAACLAYRPTRACRPIITRRPPPRAAAGGGAGRRRPAPERKQTVRNFIILSGRMKV